jgi:hypothetical protein
VKAKAGERAVPEKLNFNRVTPLLNRRYRSVSNLLALNMTGKEILPRRQFMCFNPLHISPAAEVPDTQSFV